MKLDEFHILDTPFGPIYHRHTIAGSNRWIGCCPVYLSITTGGQQSDLCQYLFNLVGSRIQYIHTETFNIGSCLGYKISKMMLCDNIDNKAMLNDLDIVLF